MSFNEVMALIMPSFIALLFYSKLANRQLALIDGIGLLALFMLCTNCLCYVVLSLLKIDVILFTISFTIKYCLMAVCIVLAITVIFRFIELNLKINLKVESIDEKEKV